MALVSADLSMIKTSASGSVSPICASPPRISTSCDFWHVWSLPLLLNEADKGWFSCMEYSSKRDCLLWQWWIVERKDSSLLKLFILRTAGSLFLPEASLSVFFDRLIECAFGVMLHSFHENLTLLLSFFVVGSHCLCTRWINNVLSVQCQEVTCLFLERIAHLLEFPFRFLVSACYCFTFSASCCDMLASFPPSIQYYYG